MRNNITLVLLFVFLSSTALVITLNQSSEKQNTKVKAVPQTGVIARCNARGNVELSYSFTNIDPSRTATQIVLRADAAPSITKNLSGDVGPNQSISGIFELPGITAVGAGEQLHFLFKWKDTQTAAEQMAAHSHLSCNGTNPPTVTMGPSPTLGAPTPTKKPPGPLPTQTPFPTFPGPTFECLGASCITATPTQQLMPTSGGGVTMEPTQGTEPTDGQVPSLTEATPTSCVSLTFRDNDDRDDDDNDNDDDRDDDNRDNDGKRSGLLIAILQFLLELLQLLFNLGSTTPPGTPVAPPTADPCLTPIEATPTDAQPSVEPTNMAPTAPAPTETVAPTSNPTTEPTMEPSQEPTLAAATPTPCVQNNFTFGPTGRRDGRGGIITEFFDFILQLLQLIFQIISNKLPPPTTSPPC